MNIPIDIEILETLYQNGQLTGEGLAAIAPLQWLFNNHPELIDSERKIRKAVASIEAKHRTCKQCINFSSTHECCMTRVDQWFAYLPVTEESEACLDFQGLALPSFLKNGGHNGRV